MIKRIQEFILALGPIYVRVVVGALLVMIIGLVFFSIGYYVLGNRLVLLPGRPHIYTVYTQNLEYVVSSVETQTITLASSPTTVTTINLPCPGYIMIDLSSFISGIVVRFDVIDESSGTIVYSIIMTPGDHESIPIYSPGTYRVVAIPLHGSEYSIANIKIETGYLREKTSIIIARWFQLLGLSFVLLGFTIFLLAYKIAYKSAESIYNIPPSRIMEEIASQSYLRLFSSSRTEEKER